MVVKGLIMSRSGTRAGMQSNLAVVIRRLMSPKMTLVVMGKRRLMVITMIIMGLKGMFDLLMSSISFLINFLLCCFYAVE